jgi:hypothetical protein
MNSQTIMGCWQNLHARVANADVFDCFETQYDPRVGMVWSTIFPERQNAQKSPPVLPANAGVHAPGNGFPLSRE